MSKYWRGLLARRTAVLAEVVWQYSGFISRTSISEKSVTGSPVLHQGSRNQTGYRAWVSAWVITQPGGNQCPPLVGDPAYLRNGITVCRA